MSNQLKENLPDFLNLLLFPNSNESVESSTSNNSGSLESFNLADYMDLTDLYKLSISEKSGIRFKITTEQTEIDNLTSQLPPISTINNLLTIPVNEKNTHMSHTYESGTKRHIRFLSDCEYAEKIILSGFPSGQYILNINCHNTRTAKKYGDNYIIDLSTISKDHVIGNGTTINLRKIDVIRLICTFTSDIENYNYNICIIGKYEIFNKLTYGYVRCPLNNDIIKLYDNHPRYQYLIKNITDRPINIKMCINGYIESNSAIINSNEFVLIRFENKLIYFQGAQNEYLSDELNKCTINMSRVDNLHIYTDTVLDSNIGLEVISTLYMTYDKLHEKFSN